MKVLLIVITILKSSIVFAQINSINFQVDAAVNSCKIISDPFNTFPALLINQNNANDTAKTGTYLYRKTTSTSNYLVTKITSGNKIVSELGIMNDHSLVYVTISDSLNLIKTFPNSNNIQFIKGYYKYYYMQIPNGSQSSYNQLKLHFDSDLNIYVIESTSSVTQINQNGNSNFSCYFHSKIHKFDKAGNNKWDYSYNSPNSWFDYLDVSNPDSIIYSGNFSSNCYTYPYHISDDVAIINLDSIGEVINEKKIHHSVYPEAVFDKIDSIFLLTPFAQYSFVKSTNDTTYSTTSLGIEIDKCKKICENIIGYSKNFSLYLLNMNLFLVDSFSINEDSIHISDFISDDSRIYLTAFVPLDSTSKIYYEDYDYKCFEILIDSQSVDEFMVYPNPVNEDLKIIIPKKYSDDKLIICNILGEIILISDTNTEVDFSFNIKNYLYPGIYIAYLQNKNGSIDATQRFIVSSSSQN